MLALRVVTGRVLVIVLWCDNTYIDFILCLPDTEDASETDMAKREEEFTEIKEQYVATVL